MSHPQTHRALQDASRVGTVENQRSKQSPRGWSLEQESIEFSSLVASSSACAIFRARACTFYVIRHLKKAAHNPLAKNRRVGCNGRKQIVPNRSTAHRGTGSLQRPCSASPLSVGALE